MRVVLYLNLRVIVFHVFTMRSLLLFFRWSRLLLILLAFSGCREKLQGLNGSVTYDGEPVAVGIITFIPDADQGNVVGRSTVATITDGRFELQERDGFSGGWYLLEVVSSTLEEIEGHDEQTHREVFHFPPHTLSHNFKSDQLTFDINIPKKEVPLRHRKKAGKRS